MLKTNLEILDFIKFRLESAKKSKNAAASDFLEEDYFNHESMSKNLANFQKEYAVQLVLESLIEFIESDVK